MKSNLPVEFIFIWPFECDVMKFMMISNCNPLSNALLVARI